MARKRGKKTPQDASASKVTGPRPGPVSAEAGLKLLVFCAGAVLMGLEITGSRVLAPHFGNSIFVWGSLISVFLVALAAGYYVGGKLADRRPWQWLLNSICIGVSVWVIGLASFGHGVCESVESSGFGLQWGPLVASALLFLPPSVGLAIVSPFSVRIAATTIQTVGRISGTLYALSTVGSIVGTLLTTFVLIPSIGIAWILRTLGIVMLVAAIFTLPRSSDARERIVMAILLLLTMAVFFLPQSGPVTLGAGDVIVLDEDTPYHHITVIDNRLNESRELRFDKYIESSIRLKPPYASLVSYTKYFHLAFLVRPKMERVLFIGAGGGIGPREFLMHDPQLQIDVVDIDPRILEIAKSQFFLPDSPQITLVAEDGRMFLQHSAATYSCIVVDAFTIGGRIPFHLVTREFFRNCRIRMDSRGVFVMNLGSALEGPLSGIYRSLYRTVSDVYPSVYVFAVDGGGGPQQTTNIVFIACSDEQRISAADWAARAARHESASVVRAADLTSAVKDLILDPLRDPSAPIFTDDYAPVEMLAF